MDIVTNRIDRLKEAIDSATSSAKDEEKSSAGDKYETGRAMMHLEIAKYNAQLDQIAKEKKVLDSINCFEVQKKAVLGSAVKSSHGNYYLSVAVGNLSYEGVTYIAISPASPIGQLLIGLNEGDTFCFRNQSYIIDKVY
jgi:transcription elongation GreA/GreB family factor